MPRLTSAQAFALALDFHDLSTAVGNFRFGADSTLTPAQRKRLEDLQFDLLNASTQFNAVSISLGLDELEEALADIGDATKRMKKAIKSIQQVQKTIKIATAAVTLGAAIVSANPAAIASGLAGVASALQPAP